MSRRGEAPSRDAEIVGIPGRASEQEWEDAPPASPPPVVGARVPCPKCGAMLGYEPGSASLLCEHCGHRTVVPPSASTIEEVQFELALQRLEETRETMEARVVTCRGCGASTEVMAEVAAANCPYCGTHFNITEQTTRVIRPNAVLPFAIPGTQVERTFREWMRGLWFAPNALRREAQQGRHMEGIYLPYWTYDAATATTYAGSRGDHHMKSVGHGKNRRTVVTTRWRAVRGAVARRFDDVLVPASTSELMALAEELGPWSLAAMKPYDHRWVAGFLAEAYRIDLRKGLERAKVHMSAAIDRDIRAQIGGDVQRIDWKQTDYADVTFKHILLPLWVGSFRYRGKVYRFTVNGESGRMSGERPWSVWKILLAALAGLLVAGALGLIASQR
jgi:DNA-directed RNA polymerase subunit RPC12/RpoP